MMIRGNCGKRVMPTISVVAIEGHPKKFVVPEEAVPEIRDPDGITKIVVTKVEINNADDGPFDAVEEANEGLAWRECEIPDDNDEDMICSYEDDFNDSIGIDPLSVNQHSDENKQEIEDQNSLEDISGFLFSNSTSSKRRSDETITQTDDSVSEKMCIVSERQSGIVSKRKQKLQLRKVDSNYSDCDKNDGVDEDCLVEEELEQQQVKVCKYKEPKDPAKTQLELIKYLGEMKKTGDGKLTFRSITIIEREVNKLECGQCGYISSEEATYPNSILLVSLQMRKHVMETHLGGYSCPLCSDRPPAKKFFSQRRHMRLKHSTTGIGIECGICAKPYKYISEAYRFHLFTHKSEEERQEAIRSGVKLPAYRLWEKQLKHHMEIYRDEEERDKKRLPCYVCGKLLFSKFIKNHERSHQDQDQAIKKSVPKPLPRHPCMICRRIFATSFRLSLHVRREHTGEKM